jgi:hypothetical protein
VRVTLGTAGIAGAIAGVVGLVVPAIWTPAPLKPVATIDAVRADGTSARCFVVRGRVLPGSIGSLWLIKAEAGEGWQEVGQIYTPPGTWGSRVCASNPAARTVRLALVLASDRLDATFSRLVPEPKNEAKEEIPEWMGRHADMQQQGGRGRHREFAALPDGASLVASLNVHVAGAFDPFASLASKGPMGLSR